MDFAQQLRDALGLEQEVDDDAAIAYIRDLQQFAESDDAPYEGGGAEPPAPSVTPQGQSQSAPVVDVDALVAARVAASTGVYKETLAEQSAEIAALKKAWADREANEAVQVRDQVLASAVADAKITVADAKPDGKWGKRYDAAPDVTASILADMSPGVAMNIAASGHSGTSDALGTDESALDADFERILKGGA